MSNNQFNKNLRINLLEMMNYSNVKKIKKKLSDVDILGQLNIIYQLSDRKPNGKEIGDTLIYLLDRKLIKDIEIGSVVMYAITPGGKNLLKRIYDEDETAII